MRSHRFAQGGLQLTAAFCADAERPACIRRVSARLGALSSACGASRRVSALFGLRAARLGAASRRLKRQGYAEIGSRHRKVDMEAEMPGGRKANVDVQRWADGLQSSGEIGRVSPEGHR